MGGAAAGGTRLGRRPEVGEEATGRAGGQESLETSDGLEALSSVFLLGKSLSLDTSSSGDLLALVSGSAGESLSSHLMSSRSLWETGCFTFPSPFTFKPQSPPGSHWKL